MNIEQLRAEFESVLGRGKTYNERDFQMFLLGRRAALKSQHETQLQVWRSTDSCGEFSSWDEADQYDYDRALPENRRDILIIKEG